MSAAHSLYDDFDLGAPYDSDEADVRAERDRERRLAARYCLECRSRGGCVPGCPGDDSDEEEGDDGE